MTLRRLGELVGYVLLCAAATIAASDQPVSPRVIPGCPSGRTVAWSSEGTAWDTPAVQLWITVWNPTPAVQQADVKVYPDAAPDAPTALKVGLTLAPKQRAAIWVNQWLKDNALLGNRNVATEVACSGVCAVVLATWTGNYSHVAYPPLTIVCETDPLVTPYGF